MNQSERPLSAGDVFRLVLITLLSIWLLVFSVPATLSSDEGGRGMASLTILSVLPAAPAPTAPSGAIGAQHLDAAAHHRARHQHAGPDQYTDSDEHSCPHQYARAANRHTRAHKHSCPH
jgi:hypothetical protein